MELQRLIERLGFVAKNDKHRIFRIATDTWIRQSFTGAVKVESTWNFYDGSRSYEFQTFETLKKFVEAMLAFYNENDIMSVEQKIDVIYKECVGQKNVGN